MVSRLRAEETKAKATEEAGDVEEDIAIKSEAVTDQPITKTEENKEAQSSEEYTQSEKPTVHKDEEMEEPGEISKNNDEDIEG